MAFSLDEFYSNHVNKIFTYCKYRISDYQDAQDLTSDTFHKFIKANGLDKPNPTGYLYTICQHNIIDYYRSHDKPTSTLECIDKELSYQDSFADQIQARTELIALLDQIDPETKELILLKYVQDLDPVTISHIINKSESATKSIIYRGLEELKQIAATKGEVYA